MLNRDKPDFDKKHYACPLVPDILSLEAVVLRAESKLDRLDQKNDKQLELLYDHGHPLVKLETTIEVKSVLAADLVKKADTNFSKKISLFGGVTGIMGLLAGINWQSLWHFVGGK